MAELKALCEELGLEKVRTYIASGNVAFASDRSEADLRDSIGQALLEKYGKQIGLLVRSAANWPSSPRKTLGQTGRVIAPLQSSSMVR